MTEYPDATRDVRVTKPKPDQPEQTTVQWMADELRKAKSREKKLEAALHEVFPLDLYIQMRPDVKEAYHGEAKQTIEHFIRKGINETDFKEEREKNTLGLYEYKQAASLMAVELDKIREREKRLKAALLKVFPLPRYIQKRPDVEASCEGKPQEIVDHFIEYGIHEIDIKHKNLALKTTETCLKNIRSSELSEQRLEVDNRSLTLLMTKGNLSNLRGNQEHNFAIKHTSIHYQSNSVCTWIPKNGCSNLRYSIAKQNGAITNLEEIAWIHSNNDCFNASTKEALQANYAFIILRNPFKRLLSFFLDKLCHPQQDQSEKSYDHAFKVFNFTGDLSFVDFIDYIWENPNLIDRDEHTKPQCDFLLYRKYDSYFALEKMKAANQAIHEKTGIIIDDIRDKNSIFTSKGCEYCPDLTSTTKANEIKIFLDQNKIPIIENMYTSEMIKKVATLYLQDILLYCNEIQGGADELDYWIQKAIKYE